MCGQQSHHPEFYMKPGKKSQSQAGHQATQVRFSRSTDGVTLPHVSDSVNRQKMKIEEGINQALV